MRRSWSRTCDIDDLPLASATAVGEVLRIESVETDGDFVDGESGSSKHVPLHVDSIDLVPVADEVGYEQQKIHIKKKKREKEKKKKRQNQLFKRNGIINDGRYFGTPCFTPCEKKGWCEAGVTGACDRNNYCYPSNKSGDAPIDDVEKQYCDEARSKRSRNVRDYMNSTTHSNGETKEGGGRKKKSRKRKSRKRKSRKRKSRKRKSRKRKF